MYHKKLIYRGRRKLEKAKKK